MARQGGRAIWGVLWVLSVLLNAQCAQHHDADLQDVDTARKKIPENVLRALQAGNSADVLLSLTDSSGDSGKEDGATGLSVGALEQDMELLPAMIAEPLRDEIVQSRAAKIRELQDRVLDLAPSHGIKLLRRYENMPLLHLKVDELDALIELLQQPDVEGVFEDAQYEHQLSSSLPLIQQPEVAAAGLQGDGTAIAVLDTGCDYTHPAFGSCSNAGTAGCKVAFAADFGVNDGARDDNGHGTNVSAIVLGVAPATKIIALDVFRGGSAYSSDIVAAIDWVIANRTTYNIVGMNMSLGGGQFAQPCSGDAMTDAVARAREVGVLSAIASGNNGWSQYMSAPGCAPAALSVGAVYANNYGSLRYSACTDASTAADQITCFSNSTSFLSLLAPGALINAGGHTMAGTSQATPHVAGALAVLRAAFPDESIAATVTRLTDSGPTITDARNGVTKHRLDLLAALNGEGLADRTAPSGSLQINGGDAYTRSAEVTLSLTGSDNESDVEICVSDTMGCETFEPFVGSLPWTLPGGDGNKTVYLTLRDASDNRSVVSDSIALDTTAPHGSNLSIVPADGAVYLDWTPASDTLSGFASYRLVVADNTPPSCSQGSVLYEGGATSFVHNHVQNGATYGYRLCMLDVAGNVGEGPTGLGLPAVERGAPFGAVVVNGDAEYTNSREVLLTLTATNTHEAAQICVSNTNTCSSWISYVPIIPWELTAVSGTATVRVWFRDGHGVATTTSASDSIKVDLGKPSSSTLAAQAGNAQVELSWSAARDSESGLAGYRLVAALGEAPTCHDGVRIYQGTARSFLHTGLQNGVDYGYRVCPYDVAGNETDGSSAMARPAPEFDAPLGTVTFNDGAEFTHQAQATLTISATDASGVATMCVSASASCSAWIPYTETLPWTIDLKAGSAKVNVWFQDIYGNASIAPVTDSIGIDTQSPSIGSLQAVGQNQAVSLSWSGVIDPGSGVASYRLVGQQGKEPPGCSDGPVVYSGSDTTFTQQGLDNGTVYSYRLCPIDRAGNMGSGAVASAMAVPELEPPVGTVLINGDAPYARSAEGTLTLAASDASGVAQMCVSPTPSCTEWTAYTESVAVSLDLDAPKVTYYAWFRDIYGSTTAAPVSDSIVIDTAPPTVGELSATGDKALVQLSWSGVTDAVSGVDSYKLVGQPGDGPDCADGPEIYRGSQTSFTHSGLSNGTVYSYRLCPIDRAGNMASGATASATPAPEHNPPVGSIMINGGASWANSANANVRLHATDASGVAQMCISNTPTCTSWIDYAPTADWTLDTSTTQPTVYAWFRDIYGNTTSTPAMDSISIDLTPPNCGELRTVASNAAVTVSWPDATDSGSGVAGYKLVVDFENNPASCVVGTEIYAGPGTSYTHRGLENGRVYGYRLCARDRAGNQCKGGTGTARPAPEFDAPEGGIVINSNAPFARSASVTLSLSAIDQSPVTHMCVTESESCSAWQAFEPSIAWTLGGGDGEATVRAWFRDDYGNESAAPVSDSIVLDATPPTPGMITGARGDRRNTLSWTDATDALSGVAEYRLVMAVDAIPSCDTGTNLYAGERTDYTHTGLTNGVSYGYRVCPVDAAGNIAAGPTLILVPSPDLDEPGGAVVINDEAPYTNSQEVTLTLWAMDLSAVTEMCISNTTTCKTWTAMSNRAMWTLGVRDGLAHVYVWFKDAYGNVNPVAFTDSITVDLEAPTSGALQGMPSDAAIALAWDEATDSVSGIAGYRLFGAADAIPDCSGTPLYVGTERTYTHSGLDNGRQYGYRVCPVDGAGNVGAGASVLVRPAPELFGPTCTVVINDGAPYTNRLEATLALSATDPSGVAQMCVSNSDTCDAWRAVSASLPWTLSAARDSATVRAWFKDTYGNISEQPCQGSIVVDTTAPTSGELSAEPGNGQVALSWSESTDALSGIAGYRIVVDAAGSPSCSDTSATIFTGTARTFTHTGLKNGTPYTYRLCSVDGAGNLAQGEPQRALPVPEKDGPQGSVLIDDGASFTAHREVSLSLSASDASGVAQMCISNAESCGNWQAFAPTLGWTLGADGLATVNVWFKDNYGNISSAPVSDSITVDVKAPVAGTLSAVGGDATVQLTWAEGSDIGSGVGSYLLMAAAGEAPACDAGSAVYSGSALSFTHSGLVNGRVYSYRLCPVDRVGNVGAAVIASAQPKPESMGPVGTVSIAAGAEYINTSQTTLSLAASDPSGVAKVCLSNSNAPCTRWIDMAAEVAWTLDTLSGEATVYAWFKDSYGNVSAIAATDSITVDTVAPQVGSLAAVPADASANLSWSATDALSGVARYVLVAAEGSAPDCTQGSPVYSGPATQFTHEGLSNGVTYHYRLCAIDGAGNMSDGAVTEVRVVPELEGPSGAVSINDGATYTNSPDVVLAVSAEDASGVDQMCISNGEVCEASGWRGFAPNAPWRLSVVNGIATVRVWFQDSWGNRSAQPVSDTIVVDTVAPLVGTLIATPADAQVRLNWAAASDSLSGVASYQLRGARDDVPDCNSGDELYRGTAGTFTHTGLQNGAVYAYKLCVTDHAGNIGASTTAKTRPAPEFDPPTGRVYIEDSARIVNHQEVQLALTATDAHEVTEMCLSNTGSCTQWVPYATSTTWTLAPSSGAATVRVWYRDEFGNAMSIPTSATTIVDMEGPAMGVLNALGTVGKVNLSWGAAYDIADVALYSLLRQTGEVPPDSCSQGELVYTGIDRATEHNVPAGVYSYRLCATDGVGNVSAGVTKTVTVPAR